MEGITLFVQVLCGTSLTFLLTLMKCLGLRLGKPLRFTFFSV